MDSQDKQPVKHQKYSLSSHGDDKQLEGNRNAGILYAIKNDMERIQQNSDSVYIDSY